MQGHWRCGAHWKKKRRAKSSLPPGRRDSPERRGILPSHVTTRDAEAGLCITPEEEDIVMWGTGFDDLLRAVDAVLGGLERGGLYDTGIRCILTVWYDMIRKGCRKMRWTQGW